jgi:hypothetical protein
MIYKCLWWFSSGGAVSSILSALATRFANISAFGLLASFAVKIQFVIICEIGVKGLCQRPRLDFSSFRAENF